MKKSKSKDLDFLAGAQRLELWTRGFGDRIKINKLNIFMDFDDTFDDALIKFHLLSFWVQYLFQKVI